MKRHHLLLQQIQAHLPEELANALPDSFLDSISAHYQKADQERNAVTESHSILHASLNSIYEAIMVVNLQGEISLFNPNFRSMFRIEDHHSSIETIVHLKDLLEEQLHQDSRLIEKINYSISHPETVTEYEFTTVHNKSIEAYSSPQWLGEKVVGQVWSFRDITELKLKEEEAKHRAYHDLLTGLPNRRLLSIKLNQALEKAAEHDNKTAVLFIDLDGFKDVNDSLGHRIGDTILKEVARRMEDRLPKDCLLARHDGDEFVVVLENQDNTVVAMTKAQELLEEFSEPFQVGNDNIYLSASIGVAIFPDHGDEAEKLISNADIAMYSAKQQGKNTCQQFLLESDAQTCHRLRIRNQIKTALEEEQFELFFQPKIDLETGSIRGAEALIRWRESDGHYKSPVEFIPIAEESGQIIPISQWVINRCCQHIQSWQDDLEDDFVLALNISAKHFQKGMLQEDMAMALQKYQVDPSKLELEVTETAIMDDIDLAIETLRELKRLGIRTAIDDFGTGHSSLNYLRRLPIEVLKIDKSFIDDILTSKEDRTLVKGIIDMVHALGIEVVAEGVENHHIAEQLHTMSCDLVQGFHYCKPIPEQEFLGLMRERLCYI